MFEVLTFGKQKVCEVSFAGKAYGITFIPHDPCTDFDGEIGVFTPGNRRIKYMRLKWDHKTFALRKSYIRTIRSPEDLFEQLILCARFNTNIAESIALCEHVLKYGHSKR